MADRWTTNSIEAVVELAKEVNRLRTALVSIRTIYTDKEMNIESRACEMAEIAKQTLAG